MLPTGLSLVAAVGLQILRVDTPPSRFHGFRWFQCFMAGQSEQKKHCRTMTSSASWMSELSRRTDGNVMKTATIKSDDSLQGFFLKRQHPAC